MSKLGYAVLLVAAAPVVFGQDALSHLVAESVPLRSSADIDWTQQKSALRDWIESRLPSNVAQLNADFSILETRLNAELRQAGLAEPEDPNVGFGYVSRLKLTRPAEYPEALVVQAGVSAGCGNDESVYIYRFSQKRVRLLEAHGNGKWGSGIFETRFSGPDAAGSRVFYASWYNVQCGSSWNELDYRLFRFGPGQEQAAPLFSSTHSFNTDAEVHVKLSPSELLLEFTAGAMEGGFRRTYVLHYSIGSQGVERIDPVALQPQDFVHEWLMEPWEEMQSRSGSSDTLVKWHKFLHADLVLGDYEFVQPCINRPGVIQVGVDLRFIGDHEIPEPLSVYFLVKDKGNYSYEMSELSFKRQDGCPGETPPADYAEPPSLFKKK
jgi:hypothetical protein